VSLISYLAPDSSHYSDYNNNTPLTISVKGELFPQVRHPLSNGARNYHLKYPLTPPLVPPPVSNETVGKLFNSKIRNNFPNLSIPLDSPSSKPLTILKAKKIIRKAVSIQTSSSNGRTAQKLLSQGLSYFTGSTAPPPFPVVRIARKKLLAIKEENEFSALYASEKFIQVSKQYRNFGKKPSPETISAYSNKIQSQIENFPILFMISKEIDSLLIQQMAESKGLDPSTMAKAMNLGHQIDQILRRKTKFSKIQEALFVKILNHLMTSKTPFDSNKASEKIEQLISDPSFTNPLIAEKVAKEFQDFACKYNIFGTPLSTEKLNQLKLKVRNEIKNKITEHSLSSDPEALFPETLFLAKGFSRSEYLPVMQAAKKICSILDGDSELKPLKEELFPLVFDRLLGPLSERSPTEISRKISLKLSHATDLCQEANAELDKLAVFFEIAEEMLQETLHLSEEELQDLCFDEGLCAGITTEYAANRLKRLREPVAQDSQFPCKPAREYHSGIQLHPFNLNYESLGKARFITAACSSAERLSQNDCGPLSSSYDFYHIIPKNILKKMKLRVTASFPESSVDKLAHVSKGQLPNEIRALSRQVEDRQSLLNIYLMNQKENAWHAMTIQPYGPFHFADPNIGIVSVDSLDKLIASLQAHIKIHYPGYKELFLREFALSGS
jgi:hypothetical protein